MEIPPVAAELAGISSMVLGAVIAAYALKMSVRLRKVAALGQQIMDAVKDGKLEAHEVGALAKSAVEALSLGKE